MEKRIVRCNYERVCKSNGMHKDPREFCVRCTRYIPHETHVIEHDQIPKFMKDYSLTTVEPDTTSNTVVQKDGFLNGGAG